jgi:hypothetical protein
MTDKESMKPELLDCGHPESPHSESTRGYGTDKDGKRLCYDCCRAQDLAEIEKGNPVFAYFSERPGWKGPGSAASRHIITGWPGFVLMPQAWRKSSRRIWGTRLLYIGAIDYAGREWHGTSPGEGMYCKLRLRKGQQMTGGNEHD